MVRHQTINLTQKSFKHGSLKFYQITTKTKSILAILKKLLTGIIYFITLVYW
jgi:hypothetical protein